MSVDSAYLGAIATAIDLANQIRYVEASLTPASVAAQITAEQTFAVSGITTNDMVIGVNPPSHVNYVGIAGFRVPSDGNIAIAFANLDGTSKTPAAGTYKFAILRKTT